MKSEKIEYCKKIVFKDTGEIPSILLGRVLGESNSFLFFRTKRKEYMIPKQSVISLESTNEIYEGD